MEWKQFKKQLLASNKELATAYGKNDLSYSIAKMVIDGRIARNMTQEQLARQVGTKQPSIARIERGGGALPSLAFLKKIADALDTQLLSPRFEFLEQHGRATKTTSHVIRREGFAYQIDQVNERTVQNIDTWKPGRSPNSYNAKETNLHVQS